MNGNLWSDYWPSWHTFSQLLSPTDPVSSEYQWLHMPSLPRHKAKRTFASLYCGVDHKSVLVSRVCAGRPTHLSIVARWGWKTGLCHRAGDVLGRYYGRNWWGMVEILGVRWTHGYVDASGVGRHGLRWPKERLGSLNRMGCLTKIFQQRCYSGVVWREYQTITKKDRTRRWCWCWCWSDELFTWCLRRLYTSHGRNRLVPSHILPVRYLRYDTSTSCFHIEE